jgi:hypothetical protein
MSKPITTTELGARVSLLKSAFNEQLQAFASKGRGRGGLSKKSIEDLNAGFADGVRSMYQDLARIGVLELIEAPTEEKKAVPA